jgi:hypothetical protein
MSMICTDRSIAEDLEKLKKQMYQTEDRREKHKLYMQIQELRKVYRQITGRNYKWNQIKGRRKNKIGVKIYE